MEKTEKRYFVNEVMLEYLANKDFDGLQNFREQCFCYMDELLKKDCLCSKCEPLKLYEHSDGMNRPWEQVIDESFYQNEEVTE